MITNEKGVAIDFEKLANDSKLFSKEMYMWGQKETPDLRDGMCAQKGEKKATIPCLAFDRMMDTILTSFWNL
jgi:hypothetical protein